MSLTKTYCYSLCTIKYVCACSCIYKKVFNVNFLQNMGLTTSEGAGLASMRQARPTSLKFSVSFNQE